MENVLRQVRERMQVDPVTLIEAKKEIIGGRKDEGISQTFP